MAQRISNVALIVRDYDEAIAFYCGVLGFELQEDTYQPEQDKRWVVVRPRDISQEIAGRRLCLPVPRTRSRSRLSANRVAVASSCFWQPTISTATMRTTLPKV